MSGKRRLGHYFLLKEIGSGGMAKVFLAARPPEEKKYAVKVLQPRRALDPEIRARFLREIKIIARLAHPRIVKIHDHGQCDGAYYFAMDHLSGGDLHGLRRDRAGSYRRKIEVMIGVCEGLSYAHANGVVHRDLKPSNILLDEQGEPVLVDFGIAQAYSATTEALTQSGVVLGTLNYLAPEQRESLKHTDHRTDIYALGVILYQLFTGRTPAGRFALPTELHANFSRPLEALILRCLAVDPLDRFPTVAALQQALIEVLSGPDGDDGLAAAPTAAVRPAPAATEKIGQDERRRYHLEPVLNLLRHGTTAERLEATERLANLVDASAADLLLQLLDREEEKVKWSIIKVLGELREARAVESLIGLLHHPFCREAAAEALGKIGDARALDPLVALLNAQAESGLFALVPIGRLGGAPAVPILTPFLRHEYAHIRECAVEALAQTGSLAAAPSLTACAQRDPCERVRKKARAALVECAPR